MLIVSRSGWGAAPPEHDPNPIPTPTPRLWVHHTGGSERGAAGVRAIQRYHQDSKGWNDIAYSFLIDPDGTIYEGRGAGISGAHTEGDNDESHAICLMGNFEGAEPTVQALTSLVALARHGQDRGWWVPTLGGHRDAPGAQTACPGHHLYKLLPRARQLVAAEPTNPTTNLEDDSMTFIKRRSNGYTAIVVAGKVIPVSGPSNWAEAQKGGVPAVVLDDDEYDRVVDALEPVGW